MSGWLDRYSRLASGDDMTLVFVLIRPEAPVSGIQKPGSDEGPQGSWGF
jgi:hypothetical protein